jgi:NAD(P)-dependent dehydrogenase (short-subunit alcohol dehydrogenase family)
VESGVAVNAIDPGPTDTGWIPDDLRATLVAASAAGKIGTPQEVAAVVRLLSGDAAASVTGRIIRLQSNGVVDNLMTELANRRLHQSAAGAITSSLG